MVDVKELNSMSAKDFAKVKSVIALFHLLGLSDEDISMIPEILRNWRKLVDTVNIHSYDLANLKQSSFKQKGGNVDISSETPENIRNMFGFGESLEKVSFNEGGTSK